MVARVRPRQLALALPHAESLTRDNFMEGAAKSPGGMGKGEGGSGKSGE